MHLITVLLNDEDGFIISAELVLIATIAVLGMIVGLSQVQNSVTSELNDVAHAIGALNQSYYYSGFSAWKWGGWMKSRTVGSVFWDGLDACDGYGCMVVCDGASAECGNFGGYCGGIGGGYAGGVSGNAVAVGGVSTSVAVPTTSTPVYTPVPTQSIPTIAPAPTAICPPETVDCPHKNP